MSTHIPISLDRFIDELEAANQERFDDPGWGFNEGQRAAVTHGEGPLWITAGPGSGKTEVLISRALKLMLVDEVPPGSIMITTFTEKAAQNLEERIVDRLSMLEYDDAVDANEIRVGTLHSLCNDIMQEYRYPDYANVELLDEDGQQLFMYNNSLLVDYFHGNSDIDPSEWKTIPNGEANAGDEWTAFEPVFPDWLNWEPNRWQATEAASKLLNRASQYRVDEDELRSSGKQHLESLAEALDHHRASLQQHSRCDFARLLERFIDFLDAPSGRRFVEGDETRDRPPLEHVLVDEYQDTNPLQQELYFRLVEQLPTPNVAVVGDDDQALYRFRGGTVECLIQFPDRAERRFGDPVETVQLKTNYRSTEDVISWCNRYVGKHPAMQAPGARAEGKDPMDVGRDGTDDQRSVKAVLQNSEAETAETVAELIDRMADEGYIDDYSQVALLFKSTKESNRWAGRYVEALRERNVPVYNPRNKAFLDREEIRLALGAVIRCLDPELNMADKFVSKGGVADQIREWYDEFETITDEYDADELVSFVERRHDELEAADERESLGISLLELLYRLLSFDPFQTWIEGEEHPEQGERLGRLTSLFDSFSSVTGQRSLAKSSWIDASVSKRFLGTFYWTFCGYLQSTDFDEPEDPHDQIPEGHVQVMTVHQAKGLEFPLVFAGNVDSEPWMSGTYWLEEQLAPYADISPTGTADDRGYRDEIRRFYVAYSRAQEDLLLMGAEDHPTELSLGHDVAGAPLSTDWFRPDRLIEDPDDFPGLATESVGDLRSTRLKRRYSITGDVLAYRRCKRQYGYYKELDFSPVHVTQLFFGRVVHDTLDRAHRHYSGEIEGVDGGEIPTDEETAGYFGEVAESLKARNVYPMSQDAEERALKYIQRFNRREGPELYPRVIDTEHRLQSNQDEFVLEGVVDVLAGDDHAGREIWDYKAGQLPSEGSELDDYRAQLNTYAVLYAYRQGEYPDRGVLYFLGEEDRDRAMFEVSFDEGEVEDALDEFATTVEEIETSRSSRDWFEITPEEAPSEGTCAECDVRWNCPARPRYGDQLN